MGVVCLVGGPRKRGGEMWPHVKSHLWQTRGDPVRELKPSSRRKKTITIQAVGGRGESGFQLTGPVAMKSLGYQTGDRESFQLKLGANRKYGC